MYDNAIIPLNMPLMEVPVPTIEEAGLVIDDLLQERQNLKAIKEDCEFRIQDIDKEVGHMLDQKDVKTVVWKDSLVIRRQGSKPRPILIESCCLMLVSLRSSLMRVPSLVKRGAWAYCTEPFRD
jgi:hypothetical protein